MGSAIGHPDLLSPRHGRYGISSELRIRQEIAHRDVTRSSLGSHSLGTRSHDSDQRMRTNAESEIPTAAMEAAAGAAVQAFARPQFPVDLSTLVTREALFRMARASSIRGCGNSWMNLTAPEAAQSEANELLTLIAYCYLQGMYHSIDIVRRLDLDPVLGGTTLIETGLVPEQVRSFRREHRRALTDCLTHTLVAVWKHVCPTAVAGDLWMSSRDEDSRVNRRQFGFLEPFYLHAQDRVDRAVVLDSMALDY